MDARGYGEGPPGVGSAAGTYRRERATDELLRCGKGRPPKVDRKVNQTIRIEPDVLEAYRQEGKGWQTHINEMLRQNMPKHNK